MRERKTSVLLNVRLKAWHGGARQTFGPNVKQAFCPYVRFKAWHGGARQTFGPNLGFKFDMRERKTSVLPQCKVEGLAWWGYRQTFGPNLGFKFEMRERKTSVLLNVRLKAWHAAARQTFGPNLSFKFEMRERKTSVLPQCKVEGLAWWG